LRAIGRSGKRCIERNDRVIVASAIEQRVATIVERAGVTGRKRQRRVEVGERVGGLAERRLRSATVDQRFDMARIFGDHLIERGQRLLMAVEREERVAVGLQNVRIARLERECALASGERFAIALERMQYIGKIHPGIRRAAIDLQRRHHQPVRFTHLSALRLDEAKQMQRVEVLRRRFEHARVQLLGLAQLALPVQGERVLHGGGNVEWAGLHGL